MNWKTILAILAVAVLLPACGSTGDYEEGIPGPGTGTGGYKVGKPYRVAGVWYYPEEDPDYDQVGWASWYGPNFHGKQTANGEIFNMNALTAAHTTLPLPSVVQVTNLENGRTIRLKVNDRGPFAKNRILDVSRRAAQLLGFEKKGVARVRVQLVRPDGTVAGAGYEAPRRVARTDKEPIGPLYVQVGAFADYRNARKLVPKLTGLGSIELRPATVQGETIYRLRLGPFETRSAAKRILDRVLERGFYEARIFTDRVS